MILTLDGPPGPWLPPGVRVIAQRGAAWTSGSPPPSRTSGGPALLIGMDTPQVTSALLDTALARLAGPCVDAVIGAADDGGWWALGLRRPDPRVFLGVPMSTRTTHAAQLERLVSLGLLLRHLPELRDVDTFDDALAVADDAPASRFAERVSATTAGWVRSTVTTFCAVLRTAAPGSDAADRLVSACGRVIAMPIERWWAPPSAGELAVLDDAVPAALDVGCGPARHVLALAARGVSAIGLDTSDEAVRAARARGAAVHHGSIFDEVPGAGTWGSALLFDGNIGIGGDPEALLARVRRVLRPAGRALVEVEPPDVRTASFLVRAGSAGGAGGRLVPVGTGERRRPGQARGGLRAPPAWRSSRPRAAGSAGWSGHERDVRWSVHMSDERFTRLAPPRVGPFREDAFESPLHATRTAAWLGVALGVCFVTCFVTGFLSHLIQHPPSWFDWPSRPAGLYRLSQGVHVTTGIASIPLLPREALDGVSELLDLAAHPQRRAHDRADLAAAPGGRIALPSVQRRGLDLAVVPLGVLVPTGALRGRMDHDRRPRRARGRRRSARPGSRSPSARRTSRSTPPSASAAGAA